MTRTMHAELHGLSVAVAEFATDLAREKVARKTLQLTLAMVAARLRDLAGTRVCPAEVLGVVAFLEREALP